MWDLVLPQFVIQRVTSKFSNEVTQLLYALCEQTVGIFVILGYKNEIKVSVIRKEVQEDEDLQFSMAVALLFSFLLRVYSKVLSLIELCRVQLKQLTDEPGFPKWSVSFFVIHVKFLIFEIKMVMFGCIIWFLGDNISRASTCFCFTPCVCSKVLIFRCATSKILL
ncbi:hypothetical protein HanPSC8_Chr15g0651681 [Helianthus annuus]|nr:hypothetical protein HanPSC8_Chr15g0651681 [Helianthus annuus]